MRSLRWVSIPRDPRPRDGGDPGTDAHRWRRRADEAACQQTRRGCGLGLGWRCPGLRRKQPAHGHADLRPLASGTERERTPAAEAPASGSTLCQCWQATSTGNAIDRLCSFHGAPTTHRQSKELTPTLGRTLGLDVGQNITGVSPRTPLLKPSGSWGLELQPH